jgi:hypothetical protein
MCFSTCVHIPFLCRRRLQGHGVEAFFYRMGLKLDARELGSLERPLGTESQPWGTSGPWKPGVAGGPEKLDGVGRPRIGLRQGQRVGATA